jgi:hypothetical protein
MIDELRLPVIQDKSRGAAQARLFTYAKARVLRRGCARQGGYRRPEGWHVCCSDTKRRPSPKRSILEKGETNMRTMLKVMIPVEAGNKAIKEEVLQKTVQDFVDSAKPEAIYFLPMRGSRAMVAVFDLRQASDIPVIVEPFFHKLNGAIKLTPVMTLEDMKAGVGKAMK